MGGPGTSHRVGACTSTDSLWYTWSLILPGHYKLKARARPHISHSPCKQPWTEETLIPDGKCWYSSSLLRHLLPLQVPGLRKTSNLQKHTCRVSVTSHFMDTVGLFLWTEEMDYKDSDAIVDQNLKGIAIYSAILHIRFCMYQLILTRKYYKNDNSVYIV